MKKDKHLLPFENILTGYFTGRNFELLNNMTDLEAAKVFGKPLTVAMPSEKVAKMLTSLASELSKDSLGSIVTSSLAKQAIDEKQLQEKTGLTPSLLDAIKKDMVFTNSIPVKSLVKLLKLLGLTVDSALSAINVTFDKLQTESKAFVSVPMNIQPSFRKGMIRSEANKDLSHLKSDESYLYQNELALKKYTGRFSELYDTL